MPKRIYVGKSNDQIKQWELEINKLQKNVKGTVGNSKQAIQEKISVLQDKIREAKKIEEVWTD